MIGAGSGIAPFRSFWQERDYRMQKGEKFGKMFLFFGCRQKGDNIYADELASMLDKGVLHEVFLALSRESGKKKVCILNDYFHIALHFQNFLKFCSKKLCCL